MSVTQRSKWEDSQKHSDSGGGDSEIAFLQQRIGTYCTEPMSVGVSVEEVWNEIRLVNDEWIETTEEHRNYCRFFIEVQGALTVRTRGLRCRETKDWASPTDRIQLLPVVIVLEEDVSPSYS